MRGLPGQVTPSSFHDPVMEIAAEVQESLPELAKTSFGEFEYPQSKAASDTWENGLWAFRADTIYLRVVEELLASEGQRFDLMMVYFGGPDVVGHRFWRYAYPEEFDHPPYAGGAEGFFTRDPQYLFVCRPVDWTYPRSRRR